MRERGPADGAAAPLEDAAVGDAGVGALAPPVEGQALSAAHAVGEREAEAKPRGRGLDRLGDAERRREQEREGDGQCAAPSRLRCSRRWS